MQRPAGVVLLSVFFACLAGLLAASLGAGMWQVGFSRLMSRPEHIVVGLGTLLVIVLLGFLAYGLWDLDEDARWVAFAFFSGPTLLAALLFASNFEAWNKDASLMLLLNACFAAPCIYLQLRPIRRSFVQLVLLNLSR